MGLDLAFPEQARFPAIHAAMLRRLKREARRLRRRGVYGAPMVLRGRFARPAHGKPIDDSPDPSWDDAVGLYHDLER